MSSSKSPLAAFTLHISSKRNRAFDVSIKCLVFITLIRDVTPTTNVCKL